MKKQFLALSKGSLRKARRLASEFAQFPFFQKTLAVGLTGAIALGLLAPIPMKAIFGGIVFDPSSYGVLGHIWKEDISTGAKLIKEYNQLVKIYTTSAQLYAMSVAMAQMVSHPQRMAMMAVVPAFVNNATQNRYGETINWPVAMNGRIGFAANSWNQSTLALAPNPYLAAEHLGSSYLLARLASVEATDGASIRCTKILSQYNLNQQQNAGAIQLLKAAGIDVSKPMNAMVAQLNVANAGAQQSRMEQLSQGNIQTCLAEQQMLSNKRERDAEVENLNLVGAVQNYNLTENEDWTDAVSGFQSFRLP